MIYIVIIISPFCYKDRALNIASTTAIWPILSSKPLSAAAARPKKFSIGYGAILV